MSGQIFEKVAYQNLSALPRNDAESPAFSMAPRRLRIMQKREETRQKGEERENKDYATLCLYIGNFGGCFRKTKNHSR